MLTAGGGRACVCVLFSTVVVLIVLFFGGGGRAGGGARLCYLMSCASLAQPLLVHIAVRVGRGVRAISEFSSVLEAVDLAHGMLDATLNILLRQEC